MYFSSSQSVFSHDFTEYYLHKLPYLCNEQSERGENGQEVSFWDPFDIEIVLNTGNLFVFECWALKWNILSLSGWDFYFFFHKTKLILESQLIFGIYVKKLCHSIMFNFCLNNLNQIFVTTIITFCTWEQHNFYVFPRQTLNFA